MLKSSSFYQWFLSASELFSNPRPTSRGFPPPPYLLKIAPYGSEFLNTRLSPFLLTSPFTSGVQPTFFPLSFSRPLGIIGMKDPLRGVPLLEQYAFMFLFFLSVRCVDFSFFFEFEIEPFKKRGPQRQFGSFRDVSSFSALRSSNGTFPLITDFSFLLPVCPSSSEPSPLLPRSLSLLDGIQAFSQEFLSDGFPGEAFSLRRSAYGKTKNPKTSGETNISPSPLGGYITFCGSKDPFQEARHSSPLLGGK